MGTEDSDDLSATSTDPGGSSPLADALLAVVSSWADDFASSHGLKMSQILGLIGQMK